MEENMEIHIGNEIKKLCERQHISQRKLAELLSCREPGLSKQLSKASMDTTLLRKISSALRYDFFKLYSHRLNIQPIDPEYATIGLHLNVPHVELQNGNINLCQHCPLNQKNKNTINNINNQF